MRYDWKDIEPLMIGNWEAALLSIVNIDRKIFSGKHQPCPHCMGVDRFRWDNHFETKGDGGAICNQCGSGSGITWLMKLSGMTFPESMEALSVNIIYACINCLSIIKFISRICVSGT